METSSEIDGRWQLFGAFCWVLEDSGKAQTCCCSFDSSVDSGSRLTAGWVPERKYSSPKFMFLLNQGKNLSGRWKALCKPKGVSAEIHGSASTSGDVGISPPITRRHTRSIILSTFITENTNSLNYVLVITRPAPGCEPQAAGKAGTVTSVSVRSQVNPDGVFTDVMKW